MRSGGRLRRRELVAALAAVVALPACAGGDLARSERTGASLRTGTPAGRRTFPPVGPEPTASPAGPVDPTAYPSAGLADEVAVGRERAESVHPADYPRTASQWGENVIGVATRMNIDEDVVALTFDACGGASGSGYDAALVDFLVAEEVRATLFVNARWIDANPQVFHDLAAEPLFEIANHGTEHRPLSISGQSAYGIRGTAGPAEVMEEILANQEKIARLTGTWPGWFRSGTAHYDDIAVRIAQDLGLDVVNYDVLGDAGATFSADQVAAALKKCQPGSIALLHMNQPASGTADGVRRAVTALRRRGLEFAQLRDHGVV